MCFTRFTVVSKAKKTQVTPSSVVSKDPQFIVYKTSSDVPAPSNAPVPSTCPGWGFNQLSADSPAISGVVGGVHVPSPPPTMPTTSPVTP